MIGRAVRQRRPVPCRSSVDDAVLVAEAVDGHLVRDLSDQQVLGEDGAYGFFQYGAGALRVAGPHDALFLALDDAAVAIADEVVHRPEKELCH